MSGFEQVTGVQFTLRWDPKVLQLQQADEMDLKKLADENFAVAWSPTGRLTFSWNSEERQGVTLRDGAAILALRFRVVSAEPAGSPVGFGDAPTLREVSVGLVPANFVSVDGGVALGKEE